MNRCTALRPIAGLRAPLLARQPRRWATYDRASLTPDALLNQVEAGLGEDADGRKLKIDADAKTISTAAGDLPISPLFDPAWMKARRRGRKAEAGPVTGRFRTKLANNPFARALATPLRQCPNTAKLLPRYFLQDFELVKHPETGTGWWAPGPLSFEHVQPPEKPTDKETQDGASGAQAEPTGEAEASASASPSSGEQRPRRAPVTIYTLSKKAVVGAVGGPNLKYLSIMTGIRTGMAMGPETRDAVWRRDMDDLLLRMMRRQAVDALIARANTVYETTTGPPIHACASWEDIRDVRLRGCVLWLAGPEADSEDAGPGRYATYDVPGAKYGAKMAVHNLRWLLGEEETRRLREAAGVFRDNELLVLKQWPSISMMRLHMLLWRLQGYLSESSSSSSSAVDKREGWKRGRPETTRTGQLE